MRRLRGGDRMCNMWCSKMLHVPFCVWQLQVKNLHRLPWVWVWPSLQIGEWLLQTIHAMHNMWRFGHVSKFVGPDCTRRKQQRSCPALRCERKRTKASSMNLMATTHHQALAVPSVCIRPILGWFNRVEGYQFDACQVHNGVVRLFPCMQWRMDSSRMQATSQK